MSWYMKTDILASRLAGHLVRNSASFLHMTLREDQFWFSIRSDADSVPHDQWCKWDIV